MKNPNIIEGNIICTKEKDGYSLIEYLPSFKEFCCYHLKMHTKITSKILKFEYATIFLVFSGSGVGKSEGKEIELKCGDIYFVSAFEEFLISTDNNLEIYICSSHN